MLKRDRNPSAASIIHGLLMQKALGSTFTAKQLRHYVEDFGEKFSEGCYGGFIARAINKGIISAVDKQRDGVSVYMLLKRDDWQFSAAGHGSKPGRSVKAAPPARQPASLPRQPAPPAVTNGQPVLLPTAAMQSPPPASLGGQTPLYNRLMQLASEVRAVEQAKADITSFTTDELLEELRRRFHDKAWSL